MACKCAPALDVLKRQIDERWPNRDKASDGCCGDAAHASRTSDHNPDSSGYAHARDIDRDLGDNTDPHVLAEILLADHRAKYVIFDRHIGFLQHRGLPVAAWPPYSGVNAHTHHIHISIQPTATHDVSLWALPTAQEDDLTPEQDARLTNVEKAVARIEAAQGVETAKTQKQGEDLGAIKAALARLEAKP